MSKKSLAIITKLIWASFFVVSIMIYYVNHYMPSGPSYPTGEYVCINDDRGPCSPEYKEDLRGLNIPNWAKFFKRSESELLWIGLLLAGIIASSKLREESQ